MGKQLFVVAILMFLVLSLSCCKQNDNYAYPDKNTAIYQELDSLLSEEDIALAEDGGVLDTAERDNTEYDLVLLPYTDRSCYAGFVVKAEEHHGKWGAEKLSEFCKVKANSSEAHFSKSIEDNGNTIRYTIESGENTNDFRGEISVK